MKPRNLIATATAPDGTELELFERDGTFNIHADGLPLMGTRMHHSEEELARLVCTDCGPGARALIGGLGLGYTLRATLDLLPSDGNVVQVELVQAIVDWNRGPLAEFAGRPLEDRRVDLQMGDISAAVRTHENTFSAIMLDVDNGPSPVVDERNAWLYTDAGLYALRRALTSDGSLAIWSADEDLTFPSRLEQNGFEPERHMVHARPGRKGHDISST